MTKCHFCKRDVRDLAWNDEKGVRWITVLDCPRCGKIGVTDDTLEDTAPAQFETERAKIAAVLAERNLFPNADGEYPPVITAEDEPPPVDLKAPVLRWADLLATFPATVAERIERTVANFARLSKTPGAVLNPDADYLSALTFAEADGARTFVMQQLRDDKIVRSEGNGMVLTPTGWNLFAATEAERGSRASRVGFVAMWFDRGMDKAYDDGLKAGIEAAGFTARRVDGVPTNGRIDDQIVAEIRRSRFVVADFTGHRPSVYWEAGFAMGLGIPVIYTCREDVLKDCAFDTRQYAHIGWKDHAGLAEALAQRIKATIV